MTSSLDSFFSSGGGKSFSWAEKPIGTICSGTILAVHEPQQQTDPVDGSPVFYKKGAKTGQPKMQVRIDLQTNERDPQDPEDDGRRGLYVGGWMIGAIGDAVRKSGAPSGPKVGGTLTVRLIERQPNENPAMKPINKFDAFYEPPTAAAGFFEQAAPGGLPPLGAPVPPTPQPNIGGTGYVQQPVAQQPMNVAPSHQMVPPVAVAVPQAPAPSLPPLAPPATPPVAQQPMAQGIPAALGAIVAKPAQISDEAWAQMDDATKAAVAASLPPF